MGVGNADVLDATAVESADSESVSIEYDGVTELGETLESVQHETRSGVVRAGRQRVFRTNNLQGALG